MSREANKSERVFTAHSPPLSFFKNKFIYLIYLFLPVLGLRCCAQAFSSCGEQGLLFVAVWASHCCGFSRCGAQALGAQASIVVTRAQ